MGAKISNLCHRRKSLDTCEPNPSKNRSTVNLQNTSVPFQGNQADRAHDNSRSNTSVSSQNKHKGATVNPPRVKKRNKSDVENSKPSLSTQIETKPPKGNQSDGTAEKTSLSDQSPPKGKQSDCRAEKTSLSDQSHLEVLNCPVCKEMLRIPVYICHNGHNTCIKCLSKSENCVICHDTVSDKRNTEIERMLEEAIRPCPNASKGCEAKLYPYNIKKHVALCPYSSNQDNLEALNCPVCKEMLRTPVYLCQDGHNTCIKCLSNSENCVICHAAVSDTRNTEIERMLEEAIRPCPNASKGCEANLYPYNMEKHIALCCYSSVQCLAGWGNEMIPKCEWSGPRHELGDHVTETHRTRGGKSLFYEGRTLKDVEMDLKRGTDYHETSLISAWDELFWLHVKYIASLNKYTECLTFIGSLSGAEGFRYCHTLVSSDKDQMLTLENDVCSESDETRIVKSGMCLSLDYDFLKKFLKDGRIYGYRLHIMFKG